MTKWWLMMIMMLTTLTTWGTQTLRAQELQARVTINHAQIQGTDANVFKQLEQSLQQFINDRQWTDLQFQKHERINCVLNITINKYDKSSGRMDATATIQANRPVFDATYVTTIYNNRDADFSFDYAEFDQLDFHPEAIDNQLTALIAYYAYLIIGINLDTFSPLGGTDVLQQCYLLVNNAQTLGFAGWKAFDNSRNRYAIISDYLDETMRPLRQLQYDYYRKGLDQMATNSERARATITSALELLRQAHQARPMSLLPQIWTDIKRDELTQIYRQKGTPRERNNIYELLMEVNASQSNAWQKIKE